VTLGNLAAFLSLNLFILNLLPVPALDGGRLVFVVLEMLRGGRKIAPEREGMVHFVGLLVLLTLMFAIGFQDIMRLVRGDSFIP
jgi:regulator of sigma E protease